MRNVKSLPSKIRNRRPVRAALVLAAMAFAFAAPAFAAGELVLIPDAELFGVFGLGDGIGMLRRHGCQKNTTYSVFRF